MRDTDGAAQPTPEPFHSAPVAPPLGSSRDCHFGDKNSVCNNNVPTASDNPPPSTPGQTRKLLQARTSMESGTAPAWPPEPSAWTPRAAQQCLAFVWGSRGDPARPLSLERMALRTIPAPGAHPRPASPPSFPLGPQIPLGPQRPIILEWVRGGPGPPCRH